MLDLNKYPENFQIRAFALHYNVYEAIERVGVATAKKIHGSGLVDYFAAWMKKNKTLTIKK
jgi:hypothetical protein